MTTSGGGADGIAVVVARPVLPGREADVHEWVDELLSAARQFPGHRASGVVQPVADGSEWHVVLWYDSPDRLASWEGSIVGSRLMGCGAEYVETVAVRRSTAPEQWFAAPAPAPPPRWKTFVMTATVIVVLQFLISAALHPLVAEWPLLPRTAAVIVPLVALMTWGVMPLLSRWLRPWLHPGHPVERLREVGQRDGFA